MTTIATARSARTIRSLATWPVTAVDGTATLREVALALAENAVGAAVVLVDGRLAGVVSERDVVQHLADGANPEHVLAEEMVSAPVVSADPTETVEAVGHRMVEAGIRHVLVMDGDELVGVVSQRGVTAALLSGR